ncbi:MAG: hypothetical protein R3E79_46185 [Caldilineaceae bacterium]
MTMKELTQDTLAPTPDVQRRDGVLTGAAVEIKPVRPLEATLFDRPLLSLVRLNWETTAWIVLLVLATTLRFVNVGERAMSHDEFAYALFLLSV